MAKKNINLSGDNPRDPKGFGERPLAPPPTTGFGGDAGPMPIPPAGSPTPPGITGRLPMPPGKVIVGSLTEKERRELQAAGIDTTKPLPQNVAQILAQAQAQARQEASFNLPPPVPPDTPPLVVNTVEIDENDPKALAEFSRKMREAAAVEEAAKTGTRYKAEESAEYGEPPVRQAPPIQAASPGKPQTSIPVTPAQPSRAQQLLDQYQAEQAGLAQHAAKYANMDPSVAKAAQVAAGELPPDQTVELDNDLENAQVSFARTAMDSGTGAEVPLANCPHCGWHLELDDPVEPDPEVKQKFLASVLGRKPYMQRFELFGGSLKVTLRTLATREVDQIYKQAFYETQRDILKTPEDFYERINRLRVYLQVCLIETPSGVMADLPDGLTVETNPHAEAHWTGTPLVDQTILVNVEKYILDEVLTSESLVRSIGNVCASFNRLVAKMEAMIDNPDFWHATGSSR